MKKDVAMDFKLEECKFGGFNKDEVEQKFLQLEFNSLINRLPSLNN
jgi:hypothetical protein